MCLASTDVDRARDSRAFRAGCPRLERQGSRPRWAPVALRGEAITRVSAIGDNIVVRTRAGATLMSTDGGRAFATVSGAVHSLRPAPWCPQRSGGLSTLPGGSCTIRISRSEAQQFPIPARQTLVPVRI